MIKLNTSKTANNIFLVDKATEGIVLIFSTDEDKYIGYINVVDETCYGVCINSSGDLEFQYDSMEELVDDWPNCEFHFISF